MLYLVLHRIQSCYRHSVKAGMGGTSTQLRGIRYGRTHKHTLVALGDEWREVWEGLLGY